MAGNKDKRPLLLLVEDDPDYRAMLRGMLDMVPSAASYRVEIVSCCDDAFARFGTERPRIVVSDLNLPNHTGVDVCRAARDADASCRRVILTGLPEQVPSDMVGDGAPVQAVWEKNWEPDQLMQRFDILLRQGLSVSS